MSLIIGHIFGIVKLSLQFLFCPVALRLFGGLHHLRSKPGASSGVEAKSLFAGGTLIGGLP
jgi:hypothetical protein